MTVKSKRLQFILLIVAFLLLIPFVAMLFTNEVNWTLMDFIVAGGLLLGTGLLFDLVLRKVKLVEYRIAISIVLMLFLVLIWTELAVGIFDN